MDIMRNITRECVKRCRSKGLDVVVCAADGEFYPLMVRGNEGNPLTQLQLSKDVWLQVSKMSKLEMLTRLKHECENICKFSDYVLNTETGCVKMMKVVKTKADVVSRVKTPTKGWKRKTIAIDTHEEHVDSTELHQENVFVDETEVQDTIDQTEINNHNGIDNEDLDNTMPYEIADFDIFTQETDIVTDNLQTADVVSGENSMTAFEIKQALKLTNEKKWADVPEKQISDYLRSAESLKKLTVVELLQIIKVTNVKLGKKMKVSGQKKAELINQLSDQICDGSHVEVVVNKRIRKRSPPQLKVLASREIKKKTYPKQVINIVFANFIWPEKLKCWRASACVDDQVIISGLEDVLEPYYVPDRNPDSGEFELFVYDKTHLGSNLRKALCLNKVDDISISAWERVSNSNPEILNSCVINVSEEGKIVDQMKERLARTMFSIDVEAKMIENGDYAEALFCNILRGALYEAEDTAGISALERCRKRIALIDWLKTNVNFGEFPPYGAKIKGLSYVLYEGLRSSNEAKLYLYAIAKRGTYCARAPNTLCSETFFGTMQEMNPWGQGVLSTKGVQKHMSDFIAVTAMRMKEDK